MENDKTVLPAAAGGRIPCWIVLVILCSSSCNSPSRTAEVKAEQLPSCEWLKRPYSIYPHNYLCVDDQGRIAGTVRESNGEWSAFLGGAYCETGGGFIDEKSAKSCVGRHYRTRERASIAPNNKPAVHLQGAGQRAAAGKEGE